MAKKKKESVQPALFDERFLESYTGNAIIKDHKVAIMELIANCWDAGSSNVIIHWPNIDGDKFSIIDNGHGMTEIQFNNRYRTLSYNRGQGQSTFAEIPQDLKTLISKRPAFGTNGKGRFAAFAFGHEFFIKTWCEKIEITYKVFINNDNSLGFLKISENKRTGHGTEIYINNSIKPKLTDSNIRTEIGMRFLTDPHFEVIVNNEKVTFNDIPECCIGKIDLKVDDVGDFVITVIDVQNTDRTTQQHGIAWHVKRRLVGECTWKGSGNEHLIDGRRIAAKRYIFIVEANCLEEAVAPDWTCFLPNNSKYITAFSKIQEKIKDYILTLNKENRETTFKEIEKANGNVLKQISYVSREKWEIFIKNVQEECPSISDPDLDKLAAILANLEESQSKFSILNFLSIATPNQLDKLADILKKWDIDFAKTVLDELEFRLRLLEKLQIKVKDTSTDEVHELQPLFYRGLWIFGPEYETIEYTSNQGMTAVIQELFGVDMKGSQNRPDFAILPDSSVGLYGYAKFDEEGAEDGIDKLTIVELKRPGIPISEEEQGQAWKYVVELKKKGLIQKNTKVTCFVLGSEIAPFASTSIERDEKTTVIKSLNYDTIIKRAKSRLLNLYEKVRHAPFIEDTRVNEYIKERSQKKLF